jgi:dCMP deaminase
MTYFSPKWNNRFLALAEHIATWSKDSTQVGAVIVRPDKTIASVGYNGFPRYCDDSPDILADRELKYSRTIHAELNAVLNAPERLQGYSLYVSKPSLYGPTCDRCACFIIQAGITRVVYRIGGGDFAERWREPYARGLQLYKEAHVEVIGQPEI